MDVVVSTRSHLVRALLRICSYLGRLPHYPFRKKLDKTAGRAWPSSECPSLGPNKSRPWPPKDVIAVDEAAKVTSAGPPPRISRLSVVCRGCHAVRVGHLRVFGHVYLVTGCAQR